MLDGGSRWLGSQLNRCGRFFAYAVLSAYSVSAFAFYVRDHWVPGWDSAVYLLTARSIADGLGYSYLGSPFIQRPPGLSWLLSFLVRDGGFDFHQLNLVIMGFAVASVWVIFFVFRRRYGSGWALAIALLTGTSRLWVTHFNMVMAEFPSIMLLYMGLGLLERTAGARKWVWMPMVGGPLLLAGSAYLRTGAVAAVPGILAVYLLRQRGWIRLQAVFPLVVFLALVAPWMHHVSREAARAEHPVEQELFLDYKTAVFHVDPGDPNSEQLSASMWWARIKRNVSFLVEDGAYWILGVQNSWISYILAAMVVLGFVLSVRRNPSMFDFFALVYVMVLLGYFHLIGRLLLPVIPLAYVYILGSLRFGLRRLGRRFSGRVALRIAGVIPVLLLGLNLLGERHWSDSAPSDTGWGRARLEHMREDHSFVADWLRRNTAEDAVVLAAPAPILSLLSDRVVYTFKFRPVGYILERHHVDFAVFSWWGPRWGEQSAGSNAKAEWVLPSRLPGKSIRIYHLSGSGLLPRAPDSESVSGQ